MEKQQEEWERMFEGRYDWISDDCNEEMKAFIRQEKEKSFKAGLERAVGYIFQNSSARRVDGVHVILVSWDTFTEAKSLPVKED